jgi:IS1 family transposase
MNCLTQAKKAQVIAALVEGNSIRATVRMTGVAKNTVVKLLAEIGAACEKYQQETLHNLPCKRVQCDEIWSFSYAEQKKVSADKQGKFGYGDVWTWTALCADTKLICNWKIGTRGASTAYALMHDLPSRLKNRIQLTTDGHRAYAEAVESAFGSQIDYAMLFATVFHRSTQTLSTADRGKESEDQSTHWATPLRIMAQRFKLTHYPCFA